MLTADISILQGVGEKKASVLRTEAAISTVEDLLYYSPRRYVDRSSFKKIKDCFVNDEVTISGLVVSAQIIGGHKKRLEVIIDDGSDNLTAVFFAGIQYFSKIFIPDEEVIFFGKINFFRTKQIVHPDFDFIDNDSSIKTINTGRIIPLYKSSEKLRSAGFDSRGFRRAVRSALEKFSSSIREPLPDEMLLRNNLIGLRESIENLHFPDTLTAAEAARKRLSFNEVFYLRLRIYASKKLLQLKSVKPVINISPDLLRSIISGLPFALTADQAFSLELILREIQSPLPMNRLLQGDVGSGKTAVALSAAAAVCSAGAQTAFMAPTEILARQHFLTAQKFFGDKFKIEIVAGGMSKKDKENACNRILSGESHLIIGTHALIQDSVKFNNLRFVIIDEQHKFGVMQRTALKSSGNNPDMLVMTATPIPRSLCLTIYGDLDVSYIRTMPDGRQPVKTMIFPETAIKSVYNSLSKYMSEGRQIYYVLPLVAESEKVDLKSAIETYEKLKLFFQQFRLDLLHGKMPAAEKEAAMQRFRNGGTDLLVTTTVIEVGMDVPNANVIVIEHAERFGIAQLHQLRGRVGRGIHKSFCALIHSQSVSEESVRRIQAVADSHDGFSLAETDLSIRGAGDLSGTRQHGRSSGFEFTDLLDDMELIQAAGKEAELFLDSFGSNLLESDASGEPDIGKFIKGLRRTRLQELIH